MEEVRLKLFKLLNDELYNLSIGNLYNKERVKEMRDLCHLIIYDKYAFLSDQDISKILNLV